MCQPGWGRADAVVTLHGEESALDGAKVLVEERVAALESVALSLEQFRFEAGRRWLAAAGSLGEGGRGTGQRLGCLASVGGLRRGFLASCAENNWDENIHVLNIVCQKSSFVTQRNTARDYHQNNLVRGAFDFWRGGERVKSAGEPEGRIGEV